MDDFFELEHITAIINYEPRQVQVTDYVAAKTKDLQEFGYSTLTEGEVIKSVWKVVNKQPLTTVIDFFVKDDIVV